MFRARLRPPLSAAAAFMSIALFGCAGGPGLDPAPPSPPPVADAPAPTNIRPEELVGRWGYASYHKEPDRARTEAAARGQCNQPYTIGRGTGGGIMMHLADQPQPQELRLKAGPGRNYIGPQGPAADPRDREIVSFDGRVLVLRFVDPEVATRYGIGVYVRCGPRA